MICGDEEILAAFVGVLIADFYHDVGDVIAEMEKSDADFQSRPYSFQMISGLFGYETEKILRSDFDYASREELKRTLERYRESKHRLENGGKL